MSGRGDELRRLERRIRRRLDVRMALRRTADSLPAILQIVAGVAAAYAIAHYGLGHAFPLFAVTVTINSLGLTRDARPRRVLETLLGILLGIALADLLAIVLGTGLWQLVVVLLVVLVVGRAVSPNPGFAVAAAVPSALVMLLPPPDGGPFVRSLDGLVGGIVALLVTALIPRDPRRAERRDARTLFSVFAESLGSVVDCLREANQGAGELALARARRTQPLLDAWTASLDTAVSVARISPWIRRHVPELRRHERVLRAADLTARHLRHVARRCEYLVRDGSPRPVLAGLVAELATGIRLLGEELDDPQQVGAARSLLADLTRRLDPAALVPDRSVAEASIVMLLRPLAVDLLVGTGMDVEEARRLLPAV